MLISACFEFESVFIVISVRFKLHFLLMLIYGSFTLGRLFDSIFAHFFIGVF